MKKLENINSELLMNTLYKLDSIVLSALETAAFAVRCLTATPLEYGVDSLNFNIVEDMSNYVQKKINT
ncbi:hypothetical protein [Clostridium thermobutyricum]|uniref:Uncharacterized protein n=1 Tax=Clostridium thermobutyricum DSM 4928 TaxID=1121339 RepID=A0A1V4T0X9_9CLOT|nr:hypothetical protein [Clostridium thermobutyricum]OPX50911.1 hypothetical protein CLTHE_02120 [Clostridium thermobutyricum DSM 4928]